MCVCSGILCPSTHTAQLSWYLCAHIQVYVQHSIHNVPDSDPTNTIIFNINLKFYIYHNTENNQPANSHPTISLCSYSGGRSRSRSVFCVIYDKSLRANRPTRTREIVPKPFNWCYRFFIKISHSAQKSCGDICSGLDATRNGVKRCQRGGQDSEKFHRWTWPQRDWEVCVRDDKS